MHKFIAIIAIIITASCNTPHRLQKQQQYITDLLSKQNAREDSIRNKAIADYVLNHPCDLQPVDLDSLCQFCVQSSGNDYAGGQNIITDSANKLTQNANLITQNANNIPQYIKVPVPFKDARAEQLLRDSLIAYKERLKSLQYIIDHNKPAEVNKRDWLFWLVLGAAAALLILLAIVIFKNSR